MNKTNKIKHAVFDIETSPKATVLDGFYMDKPEFDVSKVKVGHLKKEDLIFAKIEQAKIDHEKVVEDYLLNVTKKCCLDPDYGHVLAIGIRYMDSCFNTDHTITLAGGESDGEQTVLSGFWNAYERIRSVSGNMYGWNIINFDLPFLIKRSWHLGVQVPFDVVEKYRYFHPLFVDLMKSYTFGGFGKDAFCKLEKASTSFGHIQPEDMKVTGGTFWKEWNSKDEERKKKAEAYLFNDLTMVQVIAKAITPWVEEDPELTEDVFGGDL